MPGYEVHYDHKRTVSMRYTMNVITEAWPKGRDPPQEIEHGGWEWSLYDHSSRFSTSSDAMLMQHVLGKPEYDILILTSQGNESIAIYRKQRTYIPKDGDLSYYGWDYEKKEPRGTFVKPEKK